MNIDLSTIMTERRNTASQHIDRESTLSMLTIINEEDKKVALAVEAVLPQIAEAVDVISDAFQRGGRLIYCGAGTSGRLGILDASECPPTYGTDPEQIVGLIAGGEKAVFSAVENAEDNSAQGEQDLKDIEFNSHDVLVGIAASGRTPYVIGAMNYAQQLEATVISLTCNEQGKMNALADIAIVPVVGAEVVTGSSRMKAGTAQKLVLNMLTTGSMIKVGKIYQNLMVDVAASNQKLVERQKSIVMSATDCSRVMAEWALKESEGHCKTAILMLLMNTSADEVKKLQKEQPFRSVSSFLDE